MFDILIKQAKVIDGTGNPGFTADLGIKEGKIVEIGMLDKQAEIMIDANGFCAAPGFIDPHAHDDGCAFLMNRLLTSCPRGLRQIYPETAVKV